MTKEELHQRLIDKFSQELDDYTEWLLFNPPREMLNYAAEYALKSKIVSEIKTMDLTIEQIRALLQSSNKLRKMYQAFDKQDFAHALTVQDCIKKKANDIILLNEARIGIPVYPAPFEYAALNDELDAYHLSEELNIACRDAIQYAIEQNCHDNALDSEALHQVVAQFGVPRTQFVLANTVLQQNWTEKISGSNLAWAKQIPICGEEHETGQEMRKRFVVDCNHGLTDIFIKMFRQEYCHEQQAHKVKPSVRAKLQRQPKTAIPNTPKISAKAKGQER